MSYIFFYIGHKAYTVYFQIQKIIKPQSRRMQDITQNVKEVISLDDKQNNSPAKVIAKQRTEAKLSEEHKTKLIEIVKKVKINTGKSYYETAKGLIVEGLAIDKNNKDLNMELAMIYEAEKNFTNAEYIYRDLIELHNDNYEVVKKLGYILALQKKYNEAIQMYEKAHNKNLGDIEVVDILTDLHYEIGSYPGAYKYVVMSLKEKPRNIQRLLLKAELSLREGKENDAIEAYRMVLDMQPYNTDAMDGLRSLGQKIK